MALPDSVSWNEAVGNINLVETETLVTESG